MTLSMTRVCGVLLVGISSLILWSSCAKAESMKVTDAIQKWTDPSGATVYLIEKHDLPYVNFEATFRTGSLSDPIGKEGLAGLTAELMTRGAGDKSRNELEGALDLLGSEIDASVDHGSLTISGDALVRNLDPVMNIFQDVLLYPRFEQDEFARLKRETESDIVRLQDQDRALNRRFYDRYLFGTHPYGRPEDGTLAGLKAITLDDVQTHYKSHLKASNMIFGFSGDVNREQVEEIIQKLLKKIPEGKAPALSLPELPSSMGRQVLLVDKPDRTQNQLLVGHRGPATPSKDLYSLDIVNTLFGGTFTARLNHEIRDQRGWSYGAYSYVESEPVAGTFTMWTFPASQDAMKTTKLMIRLFEDLKTKPLDKKEVEFARQYIINSFAFRIDTPEKLLDEAIRADLHGWPDDYLETYVDKIKAVSLEEVNQAVQTWLDPENFLMVMLCTAAGFEEPMRTIPGVTTVKVVPHDAKF